MTTTTNNNDCNDVDDTDMLAADILVDAAASQPRHNSSDATSWENDLEPLPLPVESSSNHPPTMPPTTLSEEVPPLTLAEEVPTRQLDDVERMICHEDFPALLSKATSVKVMRESMARSGTNLPRPPIIETTSLMEPSQVIAAVTRMKNAHCKRGQDMPVVRRGMYPITDSMIEESFEVLLKEMERCEQWFEERKQRETNKQRKVDGGGGGEAIAVKYAKWQTDILMDWMIEHKDHPFPNADEIKELGEKTGLTQSQVVNWTTNVRKRNLKATVEGGKKPHHFVDFVFLAHDRERRAAQGLAPAPPPPTKRIPRRKKQKKIKAKAPAPPIMAPPYAVPHSYRHHDYRHYGPPPSGYHHHPYYHAHQQQQHPQPSHHHSGSYHPHSHYQHPFPPPPYGYHPSPGEQDWEHKVGVVSESFDDDATNPVMAVQHEENSDALSAFAELWHGHENATTATASSTAAPPPVKEEPREYEPSSSLSSPSNASKAGDTATTEELNQEAKTLITQVDVSAATTAGRSETANTTTTGETPKPRDRDSSLNSMEMIDLESNNSFLDEYMNSTEV